MYFDETLLSTWNALNLPMTAMTSLRIHYTTGAQKWHIVSLLGDVTSPATVSHYVSMTCSEYREALTAAPTADGVHIQAIRVQE